jgi:hypothetical protein
MGSTRVSLSATSVEPLGAPPVTAPAGIAGLGAALPDSTLPPIAGISASLTRRMPVQGRDLWTPRQEESRRNPGAW